MFLLPGRSITAFEKVPYMINPGTFLISKGPLNQHYAVISISNDIEMMA
jgi:hypothetical protein